MSGLVVSDLLLISKRRLPAKAKENTSFIMYRGISDGVESSCQEELMFDSSLTTSAQLQQQN